MWKHQVLNAFNLALAQAWRRSDSNMTWWWIGILLASTHNPHIPRYHRVKGMHISLHIIWQDIWNPVLGFWALQFLEGELWKLSYTTSATDTCWINIFEYCVSHKLLCIFFIKYSLVSSTSWTNISTSVSLYIHQYISHNPICQLLW